MAQLTVHALCRCLRPPISLTKERELHVFALLEWLKARGERRIRWVCLSSKLLAMAVRVVSSGHPCQNKCPPSYLEFRGHEKKITRANLAIELFNENFFRILQCQTNAGRVTQRVLSEFRLDWPVSEADVVRKLRGKNLPPATARRRKQLADATPSPGTSPSLQFMFSLEPANSLSPLPSESVLIYHICHFCNFLFWALRVTTRLCTGMLDTFYSLPWKYCENFHSSTAPTTKELQQRLWTPQKTGSSLNETQWL